MQGSGKDAADTPERGIAGMTGIAEGDGGAADTLATPQVALEARTEREVGVGGPADAGAIDQSNLSRASDEPEVRLNEAAQALIGMHLKAVYSEIVQQPVPDEFLKLLDDLERKERS